MFKEELKLVPHAPGSYQMVNSDGIIIYVGKAKDLNKRLHSYFRGTVTGKTALMVSEVDHFEYIVTKTETSAVRKAIKTFSKITFGRRSMVFNLLSMSFCFSSWVNFVSNFKNTWKEY